MDPIENGDISLPAMFVYQRVLSERHPYQSTSTVFFLILNRMTAFRGWMQNVKNSPSAGAVDGSDPGFPVCFDEKLCG